MTGCPRALRIAVLAAAIACTAAAPAWQPSSADLVALKRTALQDRAFPIHFVGKNPSEMPKYDLIEFYPGAADPRWIWENRNAIDSPDYTRYRSRALILAAMDSGAAGPLWKQYYDDLRSQDEAQRKPAADPYHFRHAFLDDMEAKLALLAPALPAIATDPSIDAQAAKVSDQELAAFTRGYFSTPAAAVNADLPPGVLARYKGRETNKGNVAFIIERSTVIDEYAFYTDKTVPGSDDAVLGAFFEAVADSGAAGPDLKAAYDAAADKQRFGLVAARAFDFQNQRLEKSGRDDVAWILRAIRPGMSRAEVNAQLRSRNLKIDEKPMVDVLEFPIHSSIVCTTLIAVSFTFADAGRLSRVEQQPARTTCV